MRGCRPIDPVHEAPKMLRAFEGRHAVRNQCLFAIMIYTGFRISEILSLRRGDVVQYGQIVDTIHVQRRNMKGRHAGRSVDISPELRQYLYLWIHEMNERGMVKNDIPLILSQKITDGKFRSITSAHAFKIVVAPARRLALTGKIGTHSGRKTFALSAKRMLKQMQQEGKLYEDVIVCLQRLLGHVRVDSTMQYMTFDDGVVKTISTGISYG